MASFDLFRERVKQPFRRALAALAVIVLVVLSAATGSSYASGPLSPEPGEGAPYVPHSPTPGDAEINVPLTTMLSWQGGDPDSDPVTYTVAFGTSDPPPIVATGLITSSYDPGPLVTATLYYWVVTATDGLSTTVGPTWRFATTAGDTIPWALLPIAVNEYWLGSQGQCPYAECGEPYSFVRRTDQPPPFSSTDGGVTWQRNICPDPYNEDTCQGPYEGAGENLGRAFALMGSDAKPNYGSMDPRGLVHLDYRYDALEGSYYWHYLVSDNTWIHNVDPAGRREDMIEVLARGGYCKVPPPRVVQEPPPYGPYIGEWAYCWDTPSPGNCFNYPPNGRPEPYDVLEFLSGADASAAAQAMYDNGSYVGGRYAPGQRIVVAVYNSFVGANWGQGANRGDTAVLVGFFRAIIVGYGNNFISPCSGTPGDWRSYVHCVEGTPNTLFGIADPLAPLVIDLTELLLPNPPPDVPHTPDPPDGAVGVALTPTLSWQGSAPCGSVAYTVAFGPEDPPPLVATVVTPTYDPGPLAYGTTYYWAITASDGLSLSVGSTWRFTTTVPNRAPYVPYAPVPADGAEEVPLGQVLSWQGGDPDGDTVTYTVALGPVDPPPVVGTVLTTTYDPGGLLSGTTYYWAITASDRLSLSVGPTWRFTTFRPAMYRVYLPLVGKQWVFLGVGAREPRDCCYLSKDTLFGRSAASRARR